jgi:hypothetical protein
MKIIERIMKSKLFAVVAILLLTAIFIPNTQAASVTSISDTMSRLKASTASNHTIQFTTPTGVGVSENITITFPAGFTIGSVDYTDIDVTDDTVDLLLAATPGIGAGSAMGAAFSGQVLTLTQNDTDTIAAGSVVAIEIGTNATSGVTGDQQITNSTAGTQIITIGGTNDSGQLAVVIVSDDQVVISATVDPTLTFTITNNSVALLTAASGNPDASNTAYNGSNTLTIGTNANGGYSLTYNGATLTSGANTITAMATKAASSTGSEQFGINLKNNTTPNVGADPAGGSGAASADYNTADQYRFVAGTTTAMASAAGPSADTTYTVSYIANVSSNTEAGAYSTTVTYICTGTF